MWDTVDDRPELASGRLSHDLPCPWCGHAGHYYLPCDAACGCRGRVMPGDLESTSALPRAERGSRPRSAA